jgi:DNA-binding transcriptional LysR family regulator
MIDSFNEVPVFVAAVEAGGFAAAARRLNLSRSAISKTVARLEEKLGTRLFQRTTRRQGLTEDGQTLYECCLRALDELRTGRALLEAGRTEAVGKLRVSMPVLFGRCCVAPILLRLAARYPGLALELNFNDRHVDLIEDGFDLVIRNGPLGESAGLKARCLARQRTLLFAAPQYIEQHGAPTDIDDLRTHKAIVYARAGRIHPWLFPRTEALPLELTPPARLRLDDLDAIADAAVAGFGLVWLPDWLVPDRVRSGRLVQLLPEVSPLVTDIYAVWPDAPHLPSRVRAAIDILAAEMPLALSDSA